MTHVTCRLTAKNRDQLRNPTLGNRVWATFTFLKRFNIPVRRVIDTKMGLAASATHGHGTGPMQHKAREGLWKTAATAEAAWYHRTSALRPLTQCIIYHVTHINHKLNCSLKIFTENMLMVTTVEYINYRKQSAPEVFEVRIVTSSHTGCRLDMSSVVVIVFRLRPEQLNF